MHISIKPTNLKCTVPVTSHRQRQIQPVLECRNLAVALLQHQHHQQKQLSHPTHSELNDISDAVATADCDTEDEVNKLSLEVILSVKHFFGWASIGILHDCQFNGMNWNIKNTNKHTRTHTYTHTHGTTNQPTNKQAN